ncbi:MAG: ABC transporter substrate-binding protein, partial [Chloroflexota bacterium]|nr:ABC transporter substrate-binding protein [Chloroflexota bacterium]
ARVRLVGLLLLLIIGVLPLSRSVHAQALTPVSVALDWYPNANHAGLVLADQRGYFAEEGLDVELYTPADPATVLQTVGAGRDTFGISYQTDVLFAREAGVPVVSVAALVQHPLNAVMTKADSGIARPADLVGKRVGIAGLPSDEALLSTMLAADGASLADVELVNVGFDLMPALFADRVDAVIGVYWTHETILAEMQGVPVTALRVEEWGVPDYYELVMTTSEQTLADQPETVQAFLRAMQRGYTAAIAEPDAAVDALVAASPDVQPEVEREGITLLTPLWTEGDTIPFGTQTDARWQAYGDWMKTQGLLSAEVDITAAFNTDLLPPGAATPAASPPASPVATPVATPGG